MTPHSPAHRVVIVGAGLAGASVAVTLREEGYGGHVVLLGAESTPPFGRPPLSKTYLQGKEDLTGWYVKPAEWYQANDIDLRANAAVSHIDTDATRVALAGGEVMGYDGLVLCTGGRPRKPRIPGSELRGVHTLRTVADCDAIKSAARPGRRAVVIGMGFIGCEVAASLRQLGVVVTAISSGGTPLEAVLGKTVGGALARIHRERGVELIGNDRVVRFEGSGSLEAVITERGVRVECDLAVAGVGIEPNLGPVAASAIATDNGVLVDSQCRSNVDGVFAAGDVANHLHPLFGRVRVEHYNNAEKMGRAVALSILGKGEPYAYVHSFWSDQYEHSLEYVGHASSWDSLVIRGDVQELKLIGFYVRDGVLRAAAGLNRGGDPEMGDDSELRACQELIARRAHVPIDVLEDDRVDLRAIAARSQRAT